MVRQKFVDYVVHNHPSSDPIPSRADIDMTRQIVEVAKPLGVAVHDHIIFGRDGSRSQIGRDRDRRDAGATLCLPEQLRTQACCRTFRRAERRRL